MTEFITRNHGNASFEVIIKTDSKEHYKATEKFARRLIDHAKPMTNLERFRAMTDKEIARMLMAAHDCEVHIPFCQNKESCHDDLDNGITPVRCICCMLEWLNKPMEEELWQS